MIEEKCAPVPVNGREIALTVKPFEVVTLYVQPK